MTSDRPLAERIKWLLDKGVSGFFTGANSKGQGLIKFFCPECPEEHLLEIFPSDAEAQEALNNVLSELGIDVQHGGVIHDVGEA